MHAAAQPQQLFYRPPEALFHQPVHTVASQHGMFIAGGQLPAVPSTLASMPPYQPLAPSGHMVQSQAGQPSPLLMPHTNGNHMAAPSHRLTHSLPLHAAGTSDSGLPLSPPLLQTVLHHTLTQQAEPPPLVGLGTLPGPSSRNPAAQAPGGTRAAAQAVGSGFAAAAQLPAHAPIGDSPAAQVSQGGAQEPGLQQQPGPAPVPACSHSHGTGQPLLSQGQAGPGQALQPAASALGCNGSPQKGEGSG